MGLKFFLITGTIHIGTDDSASKISYGTPKHLLAKGKDTQYEKILLNVPLWRNPRLWWQNKGVKIYHELAFLLLRTLVSWLMDYKLILCHELRQSF